MGKKHGFRGTPVRPSSRMSSVGGIFERRGDPMVSAREGQEKYGRNLETENPEYDRYFAENKERERAANQLLKAAQIDIGNAFRKASKPSSQYDPQRAAANAVLKMEREMRKATVNVKPKDQNPHRVKGNFYYFPDQKEQLKDEPKPPPRPFMGVTPVESKKRRKRRKK